MAQLKYGQTQKEREVIRFVRYSRKTRPGHPIRTFQEIADELNVCGIKPRRANKWRSQSIRKVYEAVGVEDEAN